MTELRVLQQILLDTVPQRIFLMVCQLHAVNYFTTFQNLQKGNS